METTSGDDNAGPIDQAAAREALSIVRRSQWQAFDQTRPIPAWKFALFAVVGSGLLTVTRFSSGPLTLVLAGVSCVAFIVGVVVWRRRQRAVGAPDWRSAPPELRSRIARVTWSGMILLLVPWGVLNVLMEFIRDYPIYGPPLVFGSYFVVAFSGLWLGHRIWRRAYRRWLAGDPQ